MNIDILGIATENVEVVLEVPCVLGEVRKDKLEDILDVLLQSIDDGVGTGIIGIRSLVPLASRHARPVVLDDHTDDRATDVVQIEDGGFGVKADRVERVAVCHRDPREAVKVLLLDGGGDRLHACGDDLLDAVLEERGGLYGALHAACRRSALLGVADDADEGVHLGPVGLGCDLDGERVGAVGADALLPGNESAVERSAG